MKIVRSKLGLDIGSSGAINYRVISDRSEIIEVLSKKLAEESMEYRMHPGVDELADLLDTLRGLALHELQVDWSEVQMKAFEKASRKGDFRTPVGMYVSTTGRID